MKTLTTFVASLALATALGVSGAAAQAGGAANSQNNMRWNSTNVDRANPFGDINVTGAGNSANEVRTYLAGLTGEEVIELIGRCSVISPTTFASLGGRSSNAGGLNAGDAAGQNNAGAVGAAGGQGGAGGGAIGGIGAGGAGAGPNAGAQANAAGVGGGQAGNPGGPAAGNAAGQVAANQAGGANAMGGGNAVGANAAGQVAANQAGGAAGNAVGAKAGAGGSYQANATTFCTNLASAIFNSADN